MENPELKNPDMPQYTVHEYEKPIDSANTTPQHWMQMGETILKSDQYDGCDFAWYLRWRIQRHFLSCWKICAGDFSQFTIADVWDTVTRENLINAMLIASNYKI